MLAAAERSGLILFRWDRSAGILYISDSVKDVLGYSAKELTDSPDLYLELIHPDAMAEVEATARRLAADPPDRLPLLVHLRHRDGRDVWLTCTIHAARDADGKVAAWNGLATDATELVRARRAAVEGQQVFRSLFEEAPMALLMFDPHTLVIERANQRACDLYRLARAELEGSFVSELVSPEAWPQTLARIQKSVTEGQPTAIHHAVHRKADGTLFTAQVAGTNLVVGGRVRRMAAVFDMSGVSEGIGAEAGVAQALDVLPTALAVLDGSLTVVHVNPAFEQLVGGKKADYIGVGIERALDPSGAAMLREREPELSRGARIEVRAAVARKSGGALPVFIAISPVAGPADAPRRRVAVLRGASDPHQAAAEGEAAMFFDLLAHDVTNYLTAVRGYLEIMESTGSLAATPARMARVARDQSTNALNLIQETRQLVEMGRVSGGARAEGDLAALLDEAVERVGPIMQARPLKVRREYPATKAVVKGPDLLREVFVNLLHNAVKFDSHDEVILDLAIQKQQGGERGFWRVRVVDRGFGLAEKDLPRVFDRGFKPSLKGSRSADAMAPQGSDIGLSLCRFIVERAGGQIYAESRIPGDFSQGTAFVVLIPAV